MKDGQKQFWNATLLWVEQRKLELIVWRYESYINIDILTCINIRKVERPGNDVCASFSVAREHGNYVCRIVIKTQSMVLQFSLHGLLPWRLSCNCSFVLDFHLPNELISSDNCPHKQVFQVPVCCKARRDQFPFKFPLNCVVFPFLLFLRRLAATARATPVRAANVNHRFTSPAVAIFPDARLPRPSPLVNLSSTQDSCLSPLTSPCSKLPFPRIAFTNEQGSEGESHSSWK